MSAAEPRQGDLGWKASPFDLPDTDGKRWTPDTLRGPKGPFDVFICNHCPYVLAIVNRLAEEGRVLQETGSGVGAICSNDAESHPTDGFEKMGVFARELGLPFPYLHDESQVVAGTYVASCTPDFFGFDADLGLRYRGRFDDGGRVEKPDARRELHEGMKLIAETGKGPVDQTPSIGCSIKWKRT